MPSEQVGHFSRNIDRVSRSDDPGIGVQSINSIYGPMPKSTVQVRRLLFCSFGNNLHQPDGCSTFLVTDPVGDIVTWRRGCSRLPPTGPTGSNICTTEYILGSFRVDHCICNRHLCNSSLRMGNIKLLTLFSFIAISLYSKIWTMMHYD